MRVLRVRLQFFLPWKKRGWLSSFRIEKESFLF